MSGQAKRITPGDLDQQTSFGTVTVLDMRRDWDRADTKIPGAIRVHPDAYKEYANQLPKGRPIVAYCT
jgi:rhodanese-related sulfurtransferase